jgi:outer membrane receptor protein involved in Fe transport
VKKGLLLASASVALLTAHAAFAQDNSSPAGDNTSTTAAQGAVDNEAAEAEPTEIVITATRRAEALSDVPIAVSAVTAESLQNSGANDIRQLNQLAPSLLVSSTGSESNGSARVRGIGTVGDNPGLESSVAVFIDGVYRSRSGIGLNELGEVERVEVLRGPQGTLFGRNASAGLINIISKKPSFEHEGSAELTYGNYDYIRAAGSVTGPLIADTLAARLDAVYVQRDGFLKTSTGDRLNDRDRIFLRGQLLFEPNDDLEIRFIGDYTRRDEACCGAVYLSTAETVDPTPGVPGDFTAQPNRIVSVLQSLGSAITQGQQNPFARTALVTEGRSYDNVTTDWGGSVQADWDLNLGTLTSITGYRYYKAGGASDTDYSDVDLLFRADDGNNYRRFRTFSQELRLQGSAFDDKLDWLVGGYYSNEKLNVADNTTFGSQYGAFAACRLVATANPLAALRNPAAAGCLSPTGRAALGASFGALAPAILGGLDRLSTVNNVGDIRSNYRQDSENWALFTHNIFNITDKLSLTLGVRYTDESKSFVADFNNNNTICPVQQQALSPLLTNPAVPAALQPLIGGIITLTCQGNSSSALNALNLQDSFGDNEWTGTAVLSYKPTEDLLTYASFSKGYKAGGYNLDRSDLRANQLAAPTNANAANLRFGAEKVDAYEIGFKYNGRRFNLNAAAFRQEFKNFQLNTFNGSVYIVQNINACADSLNGADRDASAATGACAGDEKAGVISQGVELESTLYPAPNVAVSLGYTHAKTKYRNDLVGFNEPLDPFLFLLPDSTMSNAPKDVVTGSLAWTPDIGTSGLSGLFYVDTRMTGDYNTGSDLFPEKEQDGYVLTNARIGLRGPDQRWAVELWAQNLFDVDYQQVAFAAPFQGAGSRAQTQAFGTTANQIFSSFLAEPRTYGVTVRTKF